MEYLDIVNQQDQVISRASRAEAHRQRLLHRSINILITNSQNQVLLQLRKSTKEQYPLFWTSSVDGHVSSGESPEQAAYREMKEELGLEIELKYLTKFIVDDQAEYQIIHLFQGHYDQAIQANLKEAEKIDWFDLALFEKEVDFKITPQAQKSLAFLFRK